jgi:hypothetical protein
MDGAILIGSIHLSCVETDETRAQYIELLKGGLSSILMQLYHVAPDFWTTMPAPEHERTRE